MKTGIEQFLFIILICSCLNSCMLVNAPMYITCFDNSKGSPDMNVALERLWVNHPENRVDLKILKSIARVNPKLLENGNYIDTVSDNIDLTAKAKIEHMYFRDEAVGDRNSYRLFKSQDSKLLYSLKYSNCKSSEKGEGKASCATCLDRIIYLPIEANSEWRNYFELKPSERNKIRKLFKKDILAKLQ